MSENSVTQFILLLRDGDQKAAAPIWNHFYTRLVTLANKKLSSRVRRVVEGEDVAQSVFDSCFRAVQEGRVPDLKNRDSLWALLVTITERKAFNTNRNMTAQNTALLELDLEVLWASFHLQKRFILSRNRGRCRR